MYTILCNKELNLIDFRQQRTAAIFSSTFHPFKQCEIVYFGWLTSPLETILCSLSIKEEISQAKDF